MSTVGGPRLSTIPTFTNTYSLDFDGVDDYVSAPQSFLNGASIFSYSFWAKKVLASDDLLIGDRISTYQGAWVNWYTDGKVYFTVRGGSNLFFVTPIAVPFDTNWHHFLCTKNGTDGKIFVDGVLSAITPTNGTVTNILPATCGDDFGMGSLGGVQIFGKSIIDEVALFDTAISIGDVWNGSGKPTDLASLNPVAWYRMGDNGIYKSPQWLIPNNDNKDKVSNYSFSYDGVDDYFDLGSPSALNLPNEMTVSLWIKPSLISSGIRFVAGQSNAGAGSYQWFIDINRTSGKISIGAKNAVILTSNTTLIVDTWYHIAFTRTGTEGNWDYVFYLNGVPDGSVTGSTLNQGVQQRTCIGRIGDYNGLYFPGSIDEVAIWNSALSGTDITSIYNSGVPTDLSSLSPVGYYRSKNSTFSTNWTITDNGSGGNDGTSANMTIEDRVGEAPNSTNNALSINMDLIDRVPDTPPTP